MLVHKYLDYYAFNYPDMPALTAAETTLSYSDVETLARQMANGLLGLGMKKGDRLAVLGENTFHHLICFVAASKIGAVVAGLNFRLAAAELDFIIRDADTKVLVVVGELYGLVGKLIPMLPDSVQVITSDVTIEGEGNIEWEAFLAENDSSNVVSDVQAQDPYFQFYTSGTTGTPKGVVLSHSNLFNLYKRAVAGQIYRPNIGDTNILVTPMFHIGGAGSLVYNIFLGLHTILHQNFVPDQVINEIENNTDITIFMVPSMIMFITQIPGIDDRDFSKLKQVMYGAAPISESLLKRAMELFQCEFIQFYGLTETTGNVISLSGKDHEKALEGKPELLQSCGRAALGVEIKIMDTSGRELSVGDVGEIWIKSDTNMLTYYNLPEETSKTLTDGWIHTGDAGYLDDEGYLYLKDRIKDMLVSGGENVYPVEVENVLAKHEAIVDVAVIGVPDEKYGEALLAITVLADGSELSVEDIVEFCRGQIAGYKIPRQLKVIDELPRNPSGKVLKQILREPYWTGLDRSVG